METTTATKTNTPTASKKITRGTLLNAARKGQLWIRCDMRLTDDYAGDNADGFGKEKEFTLVVLDEKPLAWHERPADGCTHLNPSDFRYSSGCVYRDSRTGEIRWHMLANHYYTVVISDN